MPRIPLILVCLLYWLNDPTPQVHGQVPSEQEIILSLEKHRVFVDPTFVDGKEGKSASLRIEHADDLKHLLLLGKINNLWGLNVVIVGTKQSEPCVKQIATMNGLKRLRIYADHLSEEDVKRVAILPLQELSLEYPEITDKHVRGLSGLKQLKRLELSYIHVTAQALAELKRALPAKAELLFDRLPDLTLLKPLAVSPQEEPLLRLQKEKFNSALEGLRIRLVHVRAGKLSLTDPSFVDQLQRLQHAAVDLPDRTITQKVIHNCVQLWETRFRDAQDAFKAGSLEPAALESIRYHYLDAQILQMRLKKQP